MYLRMHGDIKPIDFYNDKNLMKKIHANESINQVSNQIDKIMQI